jgi:DNA-binding CsgD family transcriptional regulator
MTTLVGRAQAVADVTDAVTAGAPVAVVGEAGIGKTAVLRAAAAGSGRTVFEGGGLATLGWHTHLAIARALRRTVPAGDRPSVAQFVRDRVGAGLLVIDDAHWADQPTLELLALLAGEIAVAVGIRSGDRGARPALDAVESAGFAVTVLTALDDDAAESLVRGVRPDLPDETVAEIVRSAGGNPLYLEEQAVGSRSAGSLRLLVTERLRACSPPARQALAALALLGRPAQRRLLGPAIDELIGAHLVVATDDTVVLRHGLLGDAAASALSPADRTRLHSLLATAVIDPGEAARHHAAAGERDAAVRAALTAVAATNLTEERAAHLAVAAACAAPRQATELWLAAATSRLDADRPDQALADVLRAEPVDAGARRRAAVVQARALHGLGRHADSRAVAATALALIDSEPNADEVRLRVGLARAWVHEGRDAATAVELAGEAQALAARLDVDQPLARHVVGAALLAAGSPSCTDELGAAWAELRIANSADAGLAAADLAAAHLLFGNLNAARGTATDGRHWASEYGYLGWELHFAAVSALGLLLAGKAAAAAAEAALLLTRPLRAGDRDLATAVHVCALAHLGRYDDAASLGGDGAATTVARAETRWLAGSPHDALRLLPGGLDAAGLFGPDARRLRAWAIVETGRPLTERHDVRSSALAAELAALVAVSQGAPERAVASFDDAALAAAGQDVRAVVRCRWAGADVASRNGDLAAGRAWLQEAFDVCAEHGLAGLLPRVTRAARAAGLALPASGAARRTARGPGILSGREHEVIVLVGKGLSTADIAARLGIATSTVETQVRSAMRKLGARTRLQAASAAQHMSGAGT